MREKFSIPVKVSVEDDSGTEVDETVFAELSTVEGICFVIKDCQDDGIILLIYFPYYFNP